MKLKFVFILFLTIVLCSCLNNNHIDKKFDNEFFDSVEKSKAEFYDYDWDGLTPTESYFVNSKIKYLRYRLEPEDGYNTARVYFNEKTDSIEKYILRFVQYNSEKIFTKSTDTIYVIYPLKRLVLTYANNRMIDSTFKKEIFNHNVDFTYELKKNTEEHFHNEKFK